MRSDMTLSLVMLTLVTAGCARSTEPASPGAAQPDRTDPASLVATGDPRHCISNRNVSTTPAGDTALMFRVGTNSWFRNDLRSACPAMSRNAVLVFRSTSSQHCDMDRFDIVDPVSRMTFGSCILGSFTPVKVPRGTRF